MFKPNVSMMFGLRFASHFTISQVLVKGKVRDTHKTWTGYWIIR